MAKISLICEQCGGNIILDSANEVGTCEHCFAQFVIKQDQIVQKITQTITKHVYGVEGKDLEELLTDGYKLLEYGDEVKANRKFKQAIDLQPDCWNALLGYASTGGDRSGYLSVVPAYQRAYQAAGNEQEQAETFVEMTRYLPDRYLRAAFVRAFNMATGGERSKMFRLVSGVIGCDESEIASLAIDLCPDDWRSHFAMAKFRQIRARWCELEGNFLLGKHLPKHAEEVLNVFMRAYRMAKQEGAAEQKIVLDYISELGRDHSYAVFFRELTKRIRQEG